MVRGWGLVACALVLLAGVACSGGGSRGGATATVRTADASTTLVPVDVIPAVIDVAYVQRVVDALDHVHGDMVRALVAARVPTPDFTDRLRAIYDEPEFDRVQADFGRAVAHGLATVRSNPGDPKTRVERLITAGRGCVFIAVRRDFGPQFNDAPVEQQLHGFMALRPQKPERDGRRLNPTAWTIVFDGRFPADERVVNPCV